ncbi:MAG: phosphate ABC transporter permease subunit PstC [Oscillospiraceae bacterium]|jgi:phosphate transport system permease protein|nr:phosphate ABC transporter permease subunit PstC [Oscillospiraceae bacterium]
MRAVFLIAAFVCVLCVIFICYFLFSSGLAPIAEYGPLKFIFGASWKPSSGLFGIAPMIVGSIYVTAGAIIIGVPIGVLTAMFMSHFCQKKLYRVLKPAVSLLAGIPSVVYGFFGLLVMVPAARTLFGGVGGKSVFTASVLLGMMILPTVISVSEAALRAVPTQYYEGALALGASHERSVFFAVLPAAKSGVMTSIVLGIGRAIGEAMAVTMVAGNQPIFPASLTSGVRTLTANIVQEMGYAADTHREMLIATAVVLFVFILLINLLLSAMKGSKRR